jgi:hypothetical protein
MTETGPSVSWKPWARGCSGIKQKGVSLRVSGPPFVQGQALRTDVQKATCGEVDGSDRVRNALWPLGEVPCDVEGSPDLPNGLVVWSKDLWDPNIPGNEPYRCGEDGGGSGRKFHR